MPRITRVALVMGALLGAVATPAAAPAPASAQDVGSLPAMAAPAQVRAIGIDSPEACATRARGLDLRGRLAPSRLRQWRDACIAALPARLAGREPRPLPAPATQRP